MCNFNDDTVPIVCRLIYGILILILNKSDLINIKIISAIYGILILILNKSDLINIKIISTIVPRPSRYTSKPIIMVINPNPNPICIYIYIYIYNYGN